MITVDSHAFASAASNALAFLPANSQVKLARLVVTGDAVEFTATDGYAAGRDYAEVVGHDGTAPPEFVALLDRKALQGFDSAGRADFNTKKKMGVGRLEALDGGKGVQFTPEDKEVPSEAHFNLIDGNPDLLDMFAALDEMLDTEQPFRTAFQPTLLQRFSKVKADKNERVADLAIADPSAPVLIKIGPSFRGLIMPIDREAHAEKVGEEGLW